MIEGGRACGGGRGNLYDGDDDNASTGKTMYYLPGGGCHVLSLFFLVVPEKSWLASLATF